MYTKRERHNKEKRDNWIGPRFNRPESEGRKIKIKKGSPGCVWEVKERRFSS